MAGLQPAERQDHLALSHLRQMTAEKKVGSDAAHSLHYACAGLYSLLAIKNDFGPES